MSLSDFGLNVLAGWLANKLDQVSDLLSGKQKEENSDAKQQDFQDNPVSEKKTKLFCTFDVYFDLEKILPYLQDPIAHFLIEKEPSTFWNLACLVVESKSTGEWYVFRRGRMAMQGVGGGIRQSEIALNRLRESKAIIATWAIPKTILDEFEEGIRLWPEVKIGAIPLFSSINAEHDNSAWYAIKDRTKELLSNP